MAPIVKTGLAKTVLGIPIREPRSRVDAVTCFPARTHGSVDMEFAVRKMTRRTPSSSNSIYGRIFYNPRVSGPADRDDSLRTLAMKKHSSLAGTLEEQGKRDFGARGRKAIPALKVRA